MEPTEVTLAVLLALSTAFTNGLKALKENRPDVAVAELTKVVASEHSDRMWRMRALYFRAVANKALGKKREASRDLTVVIESGIDRVLVSQATKLYGQCWEGEGKRMPHPYAMLEGLVALSSPKAVAPHFASKQVRAEILDLENEDDVRAYLSNEFLLGPEITLTWAHQTKGHAYVGIVDEDSCAFVLELVASPDRCDWRVVSIDDSINPDMGIPRATVRNASTMVKLAGTLSRWLEDGTELPISLGWHDMAAARQAALGDDDDGGFTDDDDDFDGWGGCFEGGWDAWTWYDSDSKKHLPLAYRHVDKLTNQIILSSPVAIDGYRMVVRGADFVIEQMPEKEFAEYAVRVGWWVPGVLVPDDVKPEVKVKVQGLIKKLGAEKSTDRRIARHQLHEIGYAAYPFLQAVRDHKDPEVRLVARELLERRR